MNDAYVPELADRATQELNKVFSDEAPTAEPTSEQAVESTIKRMVAEGKVTLLSEEEERMVKSFRKFKAGLRKNGEVFKWQTAKTSSASGSAVPSPEEPAVCA